MCEVCTCVDSEKWRHVMRPPGWTHVLQSRQPEGRQYLQCHNDTSARKYSSPTQSCLFLLSSVCTHLATDPSSVAQTTLWASELTAVTHHFNLTTRMEWEISRGDNIYDEL